MTLAEKIIARAAGLDAVTPGDVVTCRIDLAMIHDSGGPRRVAPMLDELGVGVWDPARVVVVSDHYAPAFDQQSASILQLTRDWVRDQGVGSFYDQRGICHVVLPEGGHLRPGLFVVGGDSHSPTGGALGCFMFGVGATDMAAALATGETWLRVPETIRVRWDGALGEGVSAKDMALRLCATLGMDGADYQVTEYGGTAVRALPVHERMTLCNMAAELGAMTGIVEADDVTMEFVREVGGDCEPLGVWRGDNDAVYRTTHVEDASALVPQVAAPHSPANAASVTDHAGVGVQQCYIGACTGAKLSDLRMAARVLDGRRVHGGTRLLLAPASAQTTARAAAEGTLQTLLDAGAILMSSGCGACAGYGGGVLGDKDVCLSSTARNFRGRMGALNSEVYLGSPYTVAATAVRGKITDPREMLS